MNRRVFRPAIVRALLKKELKAYSRDLVYLALTIFLLAAIPAVFRILPDTVDETLTLAISPSLETMTAEARDALERRDATAEQLAALDRLDLEEEGLALVQLDDETELAAVVESRDADIGIAFPAGFLADVMTEEPDIAVRVYTDASVPAEIQGAMTSFVRELAYQFAGRELPVGMPAEDTVVLGEDRAGDQVTIQERLRPLLLFMILLMETFSMASLVSTEVLQRTVTAVLVTPARVSDFLLAKTVFGTVLSLSQALIVLALIGGITAQNWSLLLTVLVMGSMMFTGIALFVGSAGKDFMGQLFLAMLCTIPLLIPAVAVLLPGTAAAWVQAIPTYPIIDVLVGTTVYGATWAESWGALGYAALWLVVLFGAGLFALKRKVESL